MATDATLALLRDRIRGLYAITPDGLAPDDLIARCDAALGAGARVLQLRAKNESPAARRALAQALVRMCRAHHAVFIVNDDIELARVVDADGVHLGRDDGALASARAALPGRLIGASCYADAQRARRAIAQGADYIAFGSVFDSPIKPDAPRAPLMLFDQAADLGVPRVAIGGISRANAAQVRAAGADACAVITDLFGSPDTTPAEVAARAAQLRAILESAVQPTGISPPFAA